MEIKQDRSLNETPHIPYNNIFEAFCACKDGREINKDIYINFVYFIQSPYAGSKEIDCWLTQYKRDYKYIFSPDEIEDALTGIIKELFYNVTVYEIKDKNEKGYNQFNKYLNRKLKYLLIKLAKDRELPYGNATDIANIVDSKTSAMTKQVRKVKKIFTPLPYYEIAQSFERVFKCELDYFVYDLFWLGNEYHEYTDNTYWGNTKHINGSRRNEFVKYMIETTRNDLKLYDISSTTGDTEVKQRDYYNNHDHVLLFNQMKNISKLLLRTPEELDLQYMTDAQDWYKQQDFIKAKIARMLNSGEYEKKSQETTVLLFDILNAACEIAVAEITAGFEPTRAIKFVNAIDYDAIYTKLRTGVKQTTDKLTASSANAIDQFINGVRSKLVKAWNLHAKENNINYIVCEKCLNKSTLCKCDEN